MNPTPPARMQGQFETDAEGETWYRLDGIDAADPFFMALAGDSDLWAFVSSAGTTSGPVSSGASASGTWCWKCSPPPCWRLGWWPGWWPAARQPTL